MILGKELLEHGIEKSAGGIHINPTACYERHQNGYWYREGIIPAAIMHLVQRPWGVAGGTSAQPSPVDTDKPSERASDRDTLPLLP